MGKDIQKEWLFSPWKPAKIGQNAIKGKLFSYLERMIFHAVVFQMNYFWKKQQRKPKNIRQRTTGFVKLEQKSKKTLIIEKKPTADRGCKWIRGKNTNHMECPFVPLLFYCKLLNILKGLAVAIAGIQSITNTKPKIVLLKFAFDVLMIHIPVKMWPCIGHFFPKNLHF